jgi:hypothetical protein
MFYLFLDESGDLGFDFHKPGTTRYFVVAVLMLPSTADKRAMEKAVERTIKSKISPSRKDRGGLELKGAETDFNVKRYFWRQCENIDFEIYSAILDKKTLPSMQQMQTSRVYNFLARKVVDEVPWPKADIRIVISIDRSQPPHEIQILNQSLLAHLEGKISPNVPLHIYHVNSQAAKGLQAVDMFAWGIFRRYERNDTAWYNCFSGKVKREIKFSAAK